LVTFLCVCVRGVVRFKRVQGRFSFFGSGVFFEVLLFGISGPFKCLPCST